MQLIGRNSRYALESILHSVDEQLLICAPFISAREMTSVIDTLRGKSQFQHLTVHLITDLRPDNILAGSLDVEALLDLFAAGCGVRLTALARVHAKVYLADARKAWVTSANLTTSALHRNFEYGVLIEEQETAAQILVDMNGYASLGSIATQEEIKHYSTIVDALSQDYVVQRQAGQRRLLQDFQDRLEQASVEALRLQVGARSPNAVFGDAILYLLRSGPMTTNALQPRIQDLLPDLCDDDRERVIDGKRFGKLWKHHVRSAQQQLKRNGAITFRQGAWMLT